MEKITDFFKQIGERISNPFIGSFIISWLVINWKVVIVLLFYSFKDLQADKYVSFQQMIQVNINTCAGIWYPLIGAIIYTFVFPVIRNLIYAYNGYSRTWGLKWVHKITADGVMPISKYLSEIEKSDRQQAALNDLIDRESHFRNRILDLERELEKRDESVKSLNNENAQKALDLMKQDVSQLNGKWELKMKSLNPLGNKTNEININNNIMTFDDAPGGVISNFMRNNNKIFFNIQWQDDPFEDFHILNINSNNKMYGRDANGNEVSYEKLS